MKAFINWHMFTQTSLDSGSLTMLGAVIHNFSEPGEYLGTISRKGKAVGDFHLTVDKECPAMQVNIDLATLHRRSSDKCESEPGKRLKVNPKGYAVFYVSQGAGGYAVVLGTLRGKRQVEVFDSRTLKEGDLFAVTLIRPGTYSVTNVKTDAKGEVVVAYPRTRKVPYRPPKPVTIECTEKRLRPNKIKIEPAQGQVYRLKVPSRITIELVKPDVGPRRTRQEERTARRRKQPTRQR